MITPAVQSIATTTIIPLGTGGYIPTQLRQTATVLVRRGQTALLFDAGTGVARLLEPEFRTHLAGVECLNVLLSHYHLDHVIGLTWLPKLWTSELRVFGPSEPLVEVSADDALRRLTGSPLFGLPLEKFPFPTKLVPVGSEEALKVGDFTVRLLKQRHTGGSVGFRLDDCFAYITDTDPDELHVPFLSGVDLVFMDAMYDAAEYRATGGTATSKLDHGSNLGVATIAKEAGVARLGLIHINPSYSEQRCNAMVKESKSILPSTTIPNEGVPISV